MRDAVGFAQYIVAIIVYKKLYTYTTYVFPCSSVQFGLISTVLWCCIRCGPGQECILDIVPGGTELGTQVKTGSRAGRTHTHYQYSPSRIYWSFLCLTRE